MNSNITGVLSEAFRQKNTFIAAFERNRYMYHFRFYPS
jgi:hypothetical protein